MKNENATTIRVAPEFKARLATHGKFGESFEDILIRLLGKEFGEPATGDRTTKTYSTKDFDFLDLVALVTYVALVTFLALVAIVKI